MNFSEKEMDKSKEENVIATIGRAALVNGAKEFVGGVTGLDAMVAIQNTIEKNAGLWYNETNNFMTSEVYLWQQVIKNFGNF